MFSGLVEIKLTFSLLPHDFMPFAIQQSLHKNDLSHRFFFSSLSHLILSHFLKRAPPPGREYCSPRTVLPACLCSLWPQGAQWTLGKLFVFVSGRNALSLKSTLWEFKCVFYCQQSPERLIVTEVIILFFELRYSELKSLFKLIMCRHIKLFFFVEKRVT